MLSHLGIISDSEDFSSMVNARREARNDSTCPLAPITIPSLGPEHLLFRQSGLYLQGPS